MPPSHPANSAATPGPALCTYALGELEAALVALAQPGEGVQEGVHQARKSLRRTRAVLALGNGILGPGTVMIDRELRRINVGLSRLRDSHALVETLERLLDSKLDDDTRRLLKQVHEIALTRRLACTETELSSDPELGQRRALVHTLRMAMPSLAWERLTPSSLRIALADSDARMQRAQTRAIDRDTGGSGEDERWHRWRRRARRASQQRRALDAIGIATHQPSSAFDKRTTENLGLAQDLSLLLDHCRGDAPFSPPQCEALRAYAEPALARLRKRIAESAPEQP
jgi:CHAD domain-containing protein